jgi:hypothetical protein
MNQETDMSALFGAVTERAASVGQVPAAESWFAGGKRVGYDPKAGHLITVTSASITVTVHHYGDSAPNAEI